MSVPQVGTAPGHGSLNMPLKPMGDSSSSHRGPSTKVGRGIAGAGKVGLTLGGPPVLLDLG